jgi:hypothetical protein
VFLHGPWIFGVYVLTSPVASFLCCVPVRTVIIQIVADGSVAKNLLALLFLALF